MARKPPARVDRHKSLDSLLTIGVGLVFATITIALGIVFSLEQALRPDEWELAQTSVLIAAALVLELLWLKVPMDERLLLLDLGEELFPRTPDYAWLLVMVSNGAFLVLTILAIWPAAFALMLLVIKVVESWNAHLFKRYLDDRLQRVWDATVLPHSQRDRGIDLREWKRQARVLYEYHFDRPWYGLAVSETVLVAFAAAIATYGARDSSVDVRHVLGAIATGLLLVALISNEMVGAVWRARRDSDLDRGLDEAWLGQLATAHEESRTGRPRGGHRSPSSPPSVAVRRPRAGGEAHTSEGSGTVRAKHPRTRRRPPPA